MNLFLSFWNTLIFIVFFFASTFIIDTFWAICLATDYLYHLLIALLLANFAFADFLKIFGVYEMHFFLLASCLKKHPQTAFIFF